MKKMKALMIILGVVLLSGTEALATNLKRVNSVMQSFEEDRQFNCTSTDVASTPTDTVNPTLTQPKRSHHVELKETPRLIIGGFAPEDRGNPGDRGERKGGASR